MPPEVIKLISAVTTLVSALNESAGIPTDNTGESIDPRFDRKKEKVAAIPGLLVRFAEPQLGDKAWSQIATIFAKQFIKVSQSAIPEYGDELLPAPVPTIIQNTAKEPKESEDLLSEIMKFLGPVIIAIGGIGLSIAALFAGPGPLGTSINLIGKTITNLASRSISKMGETLSKFGDDFVKRIDDIAKGAGVLIQGGGGGLIKTLGGIAAKVGPMLLKAAKFLPFIGSAVSFYFAYQRFKEGDMVGSGMEIASGILNLIPGAGWIASAIVDVALIARDLTTTEEEREKGGMGIVGKLFSGIGDWFKKHGMTIVKSLPFIGSLVYFWESYQAGFTTAEGIKKTITAFASVLGMGPLIEPAINTLFSIFTETSEDDAGIKQTTIKPFFHIIKDYVLSQFKRLPAWIRKPLEWLGFGKLTSPGEMDSTAPLSDTQLEEIERKKRASEATGSTVTIPQVSPTKSFDVNINKPDWDNFVSAPVLKENKEYEELVKYLTDSRQSAIINEEDERDALEGNSAEEVEKRLYDRLDEKLTPVEGLPRAREEGEIFNITPPTTNIELNLGKEKDINSDIIAGNSSIQINLLRVIADKIGIPQQQIPSPASAPVTGGAPLMGNNVGNFSGGSKSSVLLPYDMTGSIA